MKKLLLVDGNSMLFRTYYATLKGRRMTTAQGIPTNAVFGFVRLLKKAMDQIQPDLMLVAWDTGKPTFRHERYQDYKGTRKELDEELILQMPIVREYLDAANITRYEEPGYEADDIIGSLAKSTPDLDTYILTSDKDLLQLIDSTTRVLLMKTGLQELDVVDETEFEARYGLKPAGMIDLKGLMGDASDNIPGVKGVGEKTALKLLHQYGTLEGVYDHISEIKGKMKEKLEAGHDSALLSKELATIYKDMHFPFSLEDLQLNPSSPQDFYKKYEMKSLLKEEGEVSSSAPWSITPIEKLTFVPDHHLILPVCDNEPFLIRRLYGFVFPHGNEIAWLPLEKAQENPDFLNQLSDWSTWDAKALMHMLDRHGLPLVQFAQDLHLAAFLLHSQATTDDALAEALEIRLPESFKDLDMKSKGGPTLERALPIWAALCQGLAEKQEAVLSAIEQEDMHSLYYDVELPLASLLYEMEKQGIDVNQKTLEKIGADFQKKKDTLASEIYDMAQKTFNIDSPKQLAEVLYDDLGLQAGKKRSTAAEILEKLKYDHPIVEKIMEYKKYSKLYSTYILGLSKYVTDGKIHTTFNQTVTQTGRLSSSDPNLQNISVRDEEGKLIRTIFTAPEGHLLLSADYSQIELRMLAHMADEQVMIQAFRDDADIHTRTATQLFNITPDQVTDRERRIAKTVNFGIIYGQTEFGLAQTLNIGRREAKEFMNIYFASYPNIHRYTNRIVAECEEQGYVKTLMNRRRYIPEIKDKNFMTREFGKRAAMNAPIQGSAADLIKIAMLAVARKMEEEQVESKLLLQIHDELILQVPEHEAEKMIALVQDAMDHAMDLQVPLKAGIHLGKNWAEAK